MASRVGDIIIDCNDPELLAVFCPTDRGQAEELTRLLDLGAKRSSIIGGGSWVVLEDPEGNEFCLMSKRIPAEPAPFHDA